MKYSVFPILILIVASIACATSENELYRVGCIAEKNGPDSTIYEKVVIVQEVDSEHYEVSFPDSGGKSNSIVEKKSVDFARCPFSFGGMGMMDPSFRPASSR